MNKAARLWTRKHPKQDLGLFLRQNQDFKGTLHSRPVACSENAYLLSLICKAHTGLSVGLFTLSPNSRYIALFLFLGLVPSGQSALSDSAVLSS